MTQTSNGTKAVVFLVVVVAVVGFTVGVAAFVQPPAPVDNTEPPTYDTATINVEPLASTGEVSLALDEGEGTIVFDRSNLNRYNREDISELTGPLTTLGYRVMYHDSGDDLNESLEEADAFVIIDPAVEMDRQDVDTIERFVEQEGRLLLLGEPVRTNIQAGLLGAIVTPVDSHLDAVANRFGIHFGTDFLYNMNENDGNHRNVLVTPTDRGTMELQHLGDVTQGVVYTATYVESRSGTPVLVASDETQRYQTDMEDREFVVAVVDGDVMAVGDSSFLRGETFNVADNEQVIASLVEFLVDGDREYQPLNGENDDNDAVNDLADENEDENGDDEITIGEPEAE